MATKSKIDKAAITDASDKEKALQIALDQIQRAYGKGAVMKLGDENAALNIGAISTGAISIDVATGIGGIPRGRIVEIYGPESSGKTTLTLHCIAEAQKAGGRAAFIDAEHALDPIYAKHLGVDIDELFVSQPDTGEQALEICDMLARSGAIDIIVIDSVAALVPKTEIQGDMGESHVGLQARLMSQALRKIAGTVGKTNTCVVFINQLREKIGNPYGNPETTTGGRALKFYASMRIDVRRVETIKKGDDPIGSRTRARIVKNKVAPPFKKAEFDIMYGEGISFPGDTLDTAVDLKIIDKAGSWYSYKDERIGQGRENAKAYLQERPEVMNEVRDKITAKLHAGDAEADEAAEVPDIRYETEADEDDFRVDEDGVIIE